MRGKITIKASEEELVYNSTPLMKVIRRELLCKRDRRGDNLTMRGLSFGFLLKGTCFTDIEGFGAD